MVVPTYKGRRVGQRQARTMAARPQQLEQPRTAPDVPPDVDVQTTKPETETLISEYSKKPGYTVEKYDNGNIKRIYKNPTKYLRRYDQNHDWYDNYIEHEITFKQDGIVEKEIKRDTYTENKSGSRATYGVYEKQVVIYDDGGYKKEYESFGEYDKPTSYGKREKILRETHEKYDSGVKTWRQHYTYSGITKIKKVTSDYLTGEKLIESYDSHEQPTGKKKEEITKTDIENIQLEFLGKGKPLSAKGANILLEQGITSYSDYTDYQKARTKAKEERAYIQKMEKEFGVKTKKETTKKADDFTTLVSTLSPEQAQYEQEMKKYDKSMRAYAGAQAWQEATGDPVSFDPMMSIGEVTFTPEQKAKYGVKDYDPTIGYVPRATPKPSRVEVLDPLRQKLFGSDLISKTGVATPFFDMDLKAEADWLGQQSVFVQKTYPTVKKVKAEYGEFFSGVKELYEKGKAGTPEPVAKVLRGTEYILKDMPLTFAENVFRDSRSGFDWATKKLENLQAEQKPYFFDMDTRGGDLLIAGTKTGRFASGFLAESAVQAREHPVRIAATYGLFAGGGYAVGAIGTGFKLTAGRVLPASITKHIGTSIGLGLAGLYATDVYLRGIRSTNKEKFAAKIVVGEILPMAGGFKAGSKLWGKTQVSYREFKHLQKTKPSAETEPFVWETKVTKATGNIKTEGGGFTVEYKEPVTVKKQPPGVDVFDVKAETKKAVEYDLPFDSEFIAAKERQLVLDQSKKVSDFFITDVKARQTAVPEVSLSFSKSTGSDIIRESPSAFPRYLSYLDEVGQLKFSDFGIKHKPGVSYLLRETKAGRPTHQYKITQYDPVYEPLPQDAFVMESSYHYVTRKTPQGDVISLEPVKDIFVVKQPPKSKFRQNVDKFFGSKKGSVPITSQMQVPSTSLTKTRSPIIGLPKLTGSGARPVLEPGVITETGLKIGLIGLPDVAEEFDIGTVTGQSSFWKYRTLPVIETAVDLRLMMKPRTRVRQEEDVAVALDVAQKPATGSKTELVTISVPVYKVPPRSPPPTIPERSPPRSPPRPPPRPPPEPLPKIFGFPDFSFESEKEKKKKKKKIKGYTFYSPSLSGLLSGKTIKKTPKTLQTGISPRYGKKDVSKQIKGLLGA